MGKLVCIFGWNGCFIFSRLHPFCLVLLKYNSVLLWGWKDITPWCKPMIKNGKTTRNCFAGVETPYIKLQREDIFTLVSSEAIETGVITALYHGGNMKMPRSLYLHSSCAPNRIFFLWPWKREENKTETSIVGAKAIKHRNLRSRASLSEDALLG